MRVLFCFISNFAAGALLFAQQAPFISISGPNAPNGSTLLMEDKIRGGLWLGGVAEGSEGLTYFDGSRFIKPVTRFPKVLVSGMAEDSAGGIWLATSGGVYREFRGHLNQVVEGNAACGLVEIAPDVFLLTLSRPKATNAELLRLSKVNGNWAAETIIGLTPQIHFEIDHIGNLLYECPAGYCEYRVVNVVNWKKGTVLSGVRHSAPQPAFPSPKDPVLRDRFDCVWMKGIVDVVYHCAGDQKQTAHRMNAGPGASYISELEDGSIVIPSFTRLTIGRPGQFRVMTAPHGFPGAINAVATRDGSLWLGNPNRLSVFHWHRRMEYWTERDGLDGNTWAVLRTSNKTFGLVGGELRVLDHKRDGWNLLPIGKAAYALLPGPGDTVLIGGETGGSFRLNSEGRIIGRADSRDPRFGLSDVKSDAYGSWWTCSDHGLVHMTTAGRSIATDDRLAETPCLYLAVEDAGDVWYSEAGPEGGFSLVEKPAGSRPRVMKFVSGGEVGVATVRFLGVDKRGRIWRGSPVGIYVADPQQARAGQWLYLNRQDGIAGIDANRRAFYGDPDGSVWFGLDSSINHLYPPDDLVHPTYAPSVFVSGFSRNSGLFEMADVVEQVEHGAKMVAHVGSLQFDRRNALRLRYRLLPEQTSWQNGRDLDITLGDMSFGPHTLEVQARLFTGPWSGTVKKSFTVLRPIWLSWPVLASFALVGGGVAAGGERWRRKRKRREDTPLPALENWRLAVLTPEVSKLEGSLLDDRFEVGAVIARGGFATVFRGWDRRQRNLACAVKIFRDEFVEKSWMSRRFQQEVSALTQIQHPNVVRIYGHGHAGNGAPYLAMELVDGDTLREALQTSRLERPQIANYLRQTGSALKEIHTRGVCHRDLKPENLMIRKTAAVGEELVLIDFSIAIVQDPDETIHGLSRAAGTLFYMAPEQAIGYADASSDIYSLAKILLEMLTGEKLSVLLPDASIDLPERVREFLTRSSFELSAASIDLIAAALEFDPSRRPKEANLFTDRIAGDLG